MIYIAICDDDEKMAEILKNKVMIFLKDNNIVADVQVYNQSRMLRYDIEEGKYFDLLLSDIKMPYINGMSLATYVKKHLPQILIIFITAHLNYAVDAFELSVFRYIPKNDIDIKLPNALRDAINIVNLQENKYYIVETPTRMEKVPYQKILYIQREGKNAVLNLIDNTTVKVRKSLTQVFEECEEEDFTFVNRGDIVNIAHIIGYKNGMIELENGICFPVSQTRLNEIKEKLSEFWRNQI